MLQHLDVRACRGMYRVQRDILIERHQRAVVFDRKCKQVEIGDLVMSVDSREIHGGIIA